MAATPVNTVKDAVSSMDTDLLEIGGVGILIGAGVLVLTKGYKLVTRFF